MTSLRGDTFTQMRRASTGYRSGIPTCGQFFDTQTHESVSARIGTVDTTTVVNTAVTSIITITIVTSFTTNDHRTSSSNRQYAHLVHLQIICQIKFNSFPYAMFLRTIRFVRVLCCVYTAFQSPMKYSRNSRFCDDVVRQ